MMLLTALTICNCLCYLLTLPPQQYYYYYFVWPFRQFYCTSRAFFTFADYAAASELTFYFFAKRKNERKKWRLSQFASASTRRPPPHRTHRHLTRIHCWHAIICGFLDTKNIQKAALCSVDADNITFISYLPIIKCINAADLLYLSFDFSVLTFFFSKLLCLQILDQSWLTNPVACRERACASLRSVFCFPFDLPSLHFSFKFICLCFTLPHGFFSLKSAELKLCIS